ncbi:hypothetical protein [Frisingicoccus sp.]|mgnify:CR=1 FL=1|uniref:hypothetical protein n=1 Tax=Frisingicoccus sp. TaxID=1918627 RepID=UPI003AB5DA42
MKTKKAIAIIMAIIMVFSMCSCAGNSGKPEEKEPASTSAEETTKETSEEVAKTTTKGTSEEASDDKENELGLTDSEMKGIYEEIEKALQEEYLDVNNIKVEDFAIPTDDESWEYFSSYCSSRNFHVDGITEEDIRERTKDTVSLSEDYVNIMSIVSCSFCDYLEQNDRKDVLNLIMVDENILTLIKNLISSNVFADTTE